MNITDGIEKKERRGIIREEKRREEKENCVVRGK